MRRVLAIALVLALAACATALARGDHSVLVAKDKDGPYLSSGGNLHIKDQAKSVFFQVRNEVSSPQEFTFEDDSFDPGRRDYRVRWFRGQQEVTDEVRSPGGYVFTLQGEKARIFEAVVKPVEPHPLEMCLVGRATVGSNDLVGFFYVNSTSVCG